MDNKTAATVRRHLWIIILPVAFLVYATSFSGIPILEQRHSVLAEADSASFRLLIQEFDLSRQYGDQYNMDHRSLGDIAQKHKIHHALYVIVASLIYHGFAGLYEFMGVPAGYALYSINALLAVCNIVLLAVLLRWFHGDRLNRFGYLALYAFSLSTWIYGSVPESWTFSATLILGFLLIFYVYRPHVSVLAVYIGVAMLNNVLLGSLLLFPVLEAGCVSRRFGEFARTVGVGGAITGATWLAALSGLSVFDGSFRPDEFLRYTRWFKQYLAYGLSLWDPYVWKVVVSNLFINTVVSHQSDPAVPQQALLSTIRESYLGLGATLAYLGLAVVGVVGVGRRFAREVGGVRSLRELLGRDDLQLAVYCLTWMGLTLVLFPPAAFLYSTAVVPLVVVLIARGLQPERASHALWLYAAVAAVILNNTSQVVIFRNALRAAF
ncbi:MAG: hypothetical protein ABIO65_12860 [Nitrospiria bacterium]